MGLWQILEGGEETQFAADVKHLVEYAAGKLLLVRETFPDYTLHDRQHADNVIKLIEQLLGRDVATLTPLEAGMLILAAYFHDIGMVYTREEVDELLREQDFRDYLDQHPSAFVRVAQEGSRRRRHPGLLPGPARRAGFRAPLPAGSGQAGLARPEFRRGARHGVQEPQ